MKRPVRPPRSSKTTFSLASVPESNVLGGSAAGNDKNIADDNAQGDLTDGLLQEFQSLVEHQTSLSSDDRESLVRDFRAAVTELADSPNNAAADSNLDWSAAIEALQSDGVVESEEGNALIRRLNQAMQPLQQKSVQAALELNRRIQEFGEDAALEWYRAQTAAKPGNESVDPASDSAPALGADNILKARSRRLRGPPAA